MSKRPEKSWSLWCDWPGCHYQFEYGDYSFFGDGYDVDEIVSECDGWRGDDGTSHYCNGHAMVWASDHENGEPFPESPYLLIHDGDTADPTSDDGRVIYVGSAS